MRLQLDRSRCQGHSRCHALAPDLVALDAFGHAVVCGEGTVTAAQYTRAQLVVANCPEGALQLVDVPHD